MSFLPFDTLSASSTSQKVQLTQKMQKMANMQISTQKDKDSLFVHMEGTQHAPAGCPCVHVVHVKTTKHDSEKSF